MQAGPDGGVAFLFGRSAPYAVHLPGLYREVKALTADQAARADRLGLGYLGLVMLLHDSSMTPGRVSAPQAIRVIFARMSGFF